MTKAAPTDTAGLSFEDALALFELADDFFQLGKSVLEAEPGCVG